MNNLLKFLTISSLLLSTSLPSFATNKSFVTEKHFQGDVEPKNCPLQKRKKGILIYNLCQVKGKPISLYIQSVEVSGGSENDALDVAVLKYKNGKLIHVSAEDFHRYGFRNQKLVAAWHLDNTIENVSSPQYRAIEKRFLAESRKGLELFGIKQK
ncbi:hypothetical protein H6G80_26015 [Nostoc sp. FACHB-87]|uniref:hypothetical protein n=1 Tax=Nostocaceae TaxID=1162 RepID=UPI00168747BB|nr:MULTISPECIES: hypothetical protein [Nostocaceae]MBD2299611.1 hypothetical protein [Nostoc sp. FACHB-190]MBD2457521.1 hypothetical protein [Nostoc sp. FACHB-87]MBD2478485.1 hypothetical protein [Anabaena sp. FACHB-83]